MRSRTVIWTLAGLTACAGSTPTPPRASVVEALAAGSYTLIDIPA